MRMSPGNRAAEKWRTEIKHSMSLRPKDPHMEWASKKAMVRQWSIADMRRLLRCAGDDVVVAERWLARLDDLVRGCWYESALQVALEAMRQERMGHA